MTESPLNPGRLTAAQSVTRDRDLGTRPASPCER